jgi:hypothetical protein
MLRSVQFCRCGLEKAASSRAKRSSSSSRSAAHVWHHRSFELSLWHSAIANFSSLGCFFVFVLFSHRLIKEPLERASNASSLATFSSVAPTVMDGTGASELWKAALLGSPVIAGGRLVSSEVLFRALFSDAAALAHVCNQPEGSRSLAPTFADELAAKVDHMPRAVVLPANSSARDVLARFAAENCSHVLIGGFGEPNRVARTVSRSEALRFVHSVSPVPTRRRSALEVSVLPDEMVVSVLRLLLLSRDPVVCGETVVSWDVVDAAGVAKVASMMKKPIGALLASVGADLPLQTVLKNLQL